MKMRTRCSIWMLNMTYPVARMRSITPRIFRRFALWVGLDRPTPRGSAAAPGEVDISPIDDTSGVVAKEPIEETEDVLLLRGLGDIELWGSGQVHFIDSQTRVKLEREVWRYGWNKTCSPRATLELGVLYSTKQIHRPYCSLPDEISLNMM